MDNPLNALADADITPLARTRAEVRSSRPIVAIVGSSGSGKTTLIESLLPRLAASGLRVAVVKHAHRGLELDKPGKDTHRAASAGAVQVVVGSADQWAVMGRIEHPRSEPSLEWLLTRLDVESVDLVIAEGFHFERCRKIEVYRPAHGRPPLCVSDPDLLAIATDAVFDGPGIIDLNDVHAIVDLILTRILHRTALAAAI
jgi:molybdopterin-guanine dinucleotide biosynthesis protein B